MNVTFQDHIIKRYNKNPFLTKNDTPYLVSTVHNVGIAKHDDRYIVLCRLHMHNGRSIINKAKSQDGFPDKWIIQPQDSWEVGGYVPNVVFTFGAVLEDNGTVKIYWDGANTVMHRGTEVVDDLVQLCLSDLRLPL